MNGKLLSTLTIVAVAFALVLGLSAFDGAKAVPGAGDEGYNWLSSGTGNLFGYDGAHNYATGGLDRDIATPDDMAYQEFPNTYHP